MGKRLSKSFKLAPGVTLRLGNKSSSLSVGGKSGRVTVNSKGQRTTTVRAGGVSATSTVTRRAAAPKLAPPASTPVSTASRARLGIQIAPRRSITDGWVASDDRAIVVHRSGHEDLRIPHSQLIQLWLDGKDLAIMSSAGDRLQLRLTTLWSPSDKRFVQIVSSAAGLGRSDH